MDDKLMQWVLSCLATVTGALALLLIGWIKGRIDKTESRIDKQNERLETLAIAVSGAVSESRVRDILHEELSSINEALRGLDDKMTQLLMAKLARGEQASTADFEALINRLMEQHR